MKQEGGEAQVSRGRLGSWAGWGSLKLKYLLKDGGLWECCKAPPPCTAEDSQGQAWAPVLCMCVCSVCRPLHGKSCLLSLFVFICFSFNFFPIKKKMLILKETFKAVILSRGCAPDLSMGQV